MAEHEHRWSDWIADPVGNEIRVCETCEATDLSEQCRNCPSTLRKHTMSLANFEMRCPGGSGTRFQEVLDGSPR